MTTSEPFSVLLPVYAGDDPGFLSRAFESATSDQKRAPDEVVIVRDGPVAHILETCLRDLVNTTTTPVTVVELPENRGLSRALDAGIEACRHDIVARMDADDVSLPERFLVQVPLVESGFDLVGSAVAEIGADEQEVLGVRRPPLTHADILRSARFHSPFNHPTVVMRRSAVARAGGYEHLPHLEDYWLWVRILRSGGRTANVGEPLLLYRVSSGAYDRRGGLGLARSELKLQIKMRGLGFTSRAEFLRNVLIRGGWRLCPAFLRHSIYGLVFRKDRETMPIADRS